MEDVHVRGDEEVGGGREWKWLAHNSNYSTFVNLVLPWEYTYKCRSVYCSTTEIAIRQDTCRFD